MNSQSQAKHDQEVLRNVSNTSMLLSSIKTKELGTQESVPKAPKGITENTYLLYKDDDQAKANEYLLLGNFFSLHVSNYRQLRARLWG
jgi:hypothetical protein